MLVVLHTPSSCHYEAACGSLISKSERLYSCICIYAAIDVDVDLCEPLYASQCIFMFGCTQSNILKKAYIHSDINTHLNRCVCVQCLEVIWYIPYFTHVMCVLTHMPLSQTVAILCDHNGFGQREGGGS